MDRFISKEAWGANPSKEATEDSHPIGSTLGVTFHWVGPGIGQFDHGECAGKVRGIERHHEYGQRVVQCGAPGQLDELGERPSGRGDRRHPGCGVGSKGRPPRRIRVKRQKSLLPKAACVRSWTRMRSPRPATGAKAPASG